MAPQNYLCPSARCEEGAILVGIVGADGVVGYVAPAMTLDPEFVKRSHEGRTPESRFRFAQPCAQHHCMHWKDKQCGLIGEFKQAVVEAGIVPRESSSPPRCTISSECRWFAQLGMSACAVCPLVVHACRPE
jgi:hypothetical protein